MKLLDLRSLGIVSLATSSLAIGVSSANAFVVGNSFTASGNGYFTASQFDFVGPPPTGSPLPQSIDAPGYFTIGASNGGGFTDGIFNPAQTVPPRASFIKDIRSADSPVAADGLGGSAVDQVGPIADGSFNPANVVTDFVRFNNLGSGGSLDFSIDLNTIKRTVNGGGAVLPATLIKNIDLEFTGILKDSISGKNFLVLGSLTPNIGAGSAFQNTTFGSLTHDGFIGSIGYQMDWEITEEVPIPAPEPLTGLASMVALGLGSVLLKRRKA